MKHLYVRFLIALRLEGAGASARLAAQFNTTVSELHKATKSADHRHWRLKEICKAYVREQFAKHTHVLKLEES